MVGGNEFGAGGEEVVERRQFKVTVPAQGEVEGCIHPDGGDAGNAGLPVRPAPGATATWR